MNDERIFSRKFSVGSVVSSESVVYEIEQEFRKTGGAKNAGELWMEKYGSENYANTNGKNRGYKENSDV